MIDTSKLLKYLRQESEGVKGDTKQSVECLISLIYTGKFDADTRYEGFKNFETFLVARWIDNDEKQIKLWQSLADQNDVNSLSELMKFRFEKRAPIQLYGGVFGVLLTSALDAVDWIDLAEHYQAQAANIKRNRES